MSIEQYFTNIPRDAPLPISWKPPAPKQLKRGPGRLRKKCPPVSVIIDDSDNENDPGDSQGTENSLESCENDELEVEKMAGMKRLYSTKQKCVVVAYAKHHSVAAAAATAAKKFSIPRTTISCWMVVGCFERDITKRGVKGAGRLLAYCSEIDEQLLIWVLESCDLHLPITIPLLRAEALELIGAESPEFKAAAHLCYV